jgi:hypothetical protein
MKAIIKFGIYILLMAIVTKTFPTILKRVHHGQYVILKESSSSHWGRVWIPKE